MHHIVSLGSYRYLCIVRCWWFSTTVLSGNALCIVFSAVTCYCARVGSRNSSRYSLITHTQNYTQRHASRTFTRRKTLDLLAYTICTTLSGVSRSFRSRHRLSPTYCQGCAYWSVALFYLKFWVKLTLLEQKRQFSSILDTCHSWRSSVNTNGKSTTSFPMNLRRTSYIGFWLVPTSVTLNDLEQHNSPFLRFFFTEFDSFVM